MNSLLQENGVVSCYVVENELRCIQKKLFRVPGSETSVHVQVYRPFKIS
jgi:hypothetical protein